MHDARHYVRLLGENWKILLVTALVACAAGVAVSRLLPRTYQAEARLLVSNPDNTVNVFGSTLPELSALHDNNVATQAELLRSRTLFAAVIQQLGLSDTPSQLMKRVKIAPVNQTSVISVIADAGDPKTAAGIANALADEYLSRFRTIKELALQSVVSTVQGEVNQATADLEEMDTTFGTRGITASQATERQAVANRLIALTAKLEELEVNMKVEQGWGIVTDEAVADPTPVGPGPLSNALVGLLAGALFGIVYIVSTDSRAQASPNTPPLEGPARSPAVILDDKQETTSCEKQLG